MTPVLRATAAAALLLSTALSASAQQEIVWTQTVNLPKGLNLPKDVGIDILGIVPGDTYAEAKAKLEKLLAEVKQPPPPAAPAAPKRPLTMGEIEAQRLSTLEGLERQNTAEMSGENQARALTETRTQFSLQAPGGEIRASYTGALALTRRMPGTRTEDRLRLHLSAPSSGQQVYAIERDVSYGSQAEQPRVAEVLAQLTQKFGGEPQPDRQTDGRFKFQFDNGRRIAPANAKPYDCLPFAPGPQRFGPDAIAEINRDGQCDVVLSVDVTYGISREHASRIQFRFSDNERAKANLTADFAFMRSYVESLRTQTKGAPPKL